ncbi:MAG: phosphotransferase family protein [Actinomycetota bacterium]|nr:phosphotransferase family protein [Actinomycetota bacterium]
MIPPLEFDLITGGHSNLTYRVTDSAGTRWVLRRPPLGHVLEGAHDMGREHRLMSALADSGVPVPGIVGLCTDHSINGADFYVTDFVDGHVLRNPEDAAAIPVDVRPALSQQLVAGLVAIHDVDLDAVGLADLGKREAYVARQLRTWLRQFTAMTSREVPLITEVHDALAARIPEQRGATLVHGDYRLDNCLVTAGGQVAAVLDWEIATLGDPLADLGILLAYWSEPADAFLPLGEAATIAEGFASRDDLVAAYGSMTGRDTSDIDFYFAFANWRLACILEGVYSRYVGGASPEVPAEVEVFAQSVLDLVERAHELVGQL